MGLEKKIEKVTNKNEEPKKKRIMTDKQKEALAKGRAKAHERMRSLKEEKKELIQYRTKHPKQ